jgi:hypothetical protein
MVKTPGAMRMALLRAQRRADGRCACGREPAPGRATCQVCFDRQVDYIAKKRAAGFRYAFVRATGKKP